MHRPTDPTDPLISAWRWLRLDTVIGVLATGCHCPAMQDPCGSWPLPSTHWGQNPIPAHPGQHRPKKQGSSRRNGGAEPTPRDGDEVGQAVLGGFIPKPHTWAGREVCPHKASLAEGPGGASTHRTRWTHSEAARATISQHLGRAGTHCYLSVWDCSPTAQSPGPIDPAAGSQWHWGTLTARSQCPPAAMWESTMSQWDPGGHGLPRLSSAKPQPLQRAKQMGRLMSARLMSFQPILGLSARLWATAITAPELCPSERMGWGCHWLPAAKCQFLHWKMSFSSINVAWLRLQGAGFPLWRRLLVRQAG